MGAQLPVHGAEVGSHLCSSCLLVLFCGPSWVQNSGISSALPEV